MAREPPKDRAFRLFSINASFHYPKARTQQSIMIQYLPNPGCQWCIQKVYEAPVCLRRALPVYAQSTVTSQRNPRRVKVENGPRFSGIAVGGILLVIARLGTINALGAIIVATKNIYIGVKCLDRHTHYVVHKSRSNSVVKTFKVFAALRRKLMMVRINCIPVRLQLHAGCDIALLRKWTLERTGTRHVKPTEHWVRNVSGGRPKLICHSHRLPEVMA
ncbi:gap-Pol polyprotein [Clonorchis sinensis]|uniref:Gap-Pol polyprotein n=1 Tax=Clonorchis sinensis TaxID=79923 RepID=G7Y4H1_CLOSI|nr:gap-Pol polyprotein [Clonorchis sinensis]